MFRIISAVTLVTQDMARSVRFYESLGFVARDGASEAFTSFPVGPTWLNLIAATEPAAAPMPLWGRTIIHVDDVDTMYDRVLKAGHETETAPADAPWGERYFHVKDPDGHELSFAKPLA
jgi:catechol 2,3-dioxygenase-like lactoylglutathione lyase family enzyme